MTSWMGLYNGVYGCSNDLTDQKYVWLYMYYFSNKNGRGVRSFKREILLLAVSVTPKYLVSLFNLYDFHTSVGVR